MTEKASCTRCPRTDVSVNADGGLRNHAANGKKTTPDNPPCPGSGQPPAGSKAEQTGDGIRFLCRVPSGPEGCGHPVQLTANRRARSHLTPHGEPCAEGGSAFPLAVGPDGYQADTADWNEEDWERVLPRPKTQEPLAGFKSGWKHEDGSECPVYLAPPSPKKLWCTDHQQHVTWPYPNLMTEFAAAEEMVDARNATVSPRVVETIDLLPTAYARPGEPGFPDDLPHDRQSQFERDMYQPLDPELQNRLLTDPHQREADAAIAEVERIRREEDAAYETSVRDGLEESRRRVLEPYDPQDPDGPGEPASGPEDVFDVTHRHTDASGTVGVHPGEAGDCRLPGCCTHPRGFEYGDDDNGHSGSFCRFCGDEDDMSPSEPEWGTPADLLRQMPADLVTQYATEPPCWDCGDRLMLAAHSFAPDGKPRTVVWSCDRNCEHTGGSGHYGRACRPQLPWQDRLGYLERGDFFRRHTATRPLDSLVYRVDAVGEDVDIISAIVVSAGRYQGRVGELTDLSEEITCTDHNGQRLRRRGLPEPAASAPAVPSPTRSGPFAPSVPTAATRPSPTPSRPAPTTSPSPAPSSGPGTTASAPRPPATSGATSKRATTSGPTAKAASSTPSAGKTDVGDAFTTAKAATAESDRYDRYGRYKLTHPATGKPVKWTRATTYAKSIADTYNLSMWSQRMTLKGAALRPDIVAAVATLDVKADRDRVNGLVEDAKKAAGVKVAANLGTALHAFTEDRDKVLVGQPVKAREIPEKLLPSVDAYEALLREFGLVPVPGLIEFTTAVLQYEIAGTSDRCYRVTRDITFKLHGRTVTLYAGEYVIGDVKSGADLSYGWMEICIQLAIYAQGINTSGVFDWNTATWGHPTVPGEDDVQIKVRTDVGLIPHLPVDREEGAPLATLFAVDLDWGWATAVLCGQVRSARKEGNLATALTVADLTDENGVSDSQFADRVTRSENPAARARTVVSRPPTLEEKARAVTTQAAASAVWKEAVAARTPKAEVDKLVQVMKNALERLVEKGA